MTSPRTKIRNDSIGGGERDNAHDRYTELCALATTGTLNDAEWRLLKGHMAKCPECTSALNEFREIGRTAIPLLLSDSPAANQGENETWSPARAGDELFTRIRKGHESGWQQSSLPAPQTASRATSWHPSRTAVARNALLLAAGMVLAAGLAGVVYRIGWKGHEAASQSAVSDADSLRKEIGGLRQEMQKEKDSLSAHLRAKEAAIETVSARAAQADAELATLKAQRKDNDAALYRETSELNEALIQKSAAFSERDALAQKLDEAQSAVASLRTTLQRLQTERTADLVQRASLELRIDGLTARLKNYEESNISDVQLLASDRDIRELMGARELSIVDVFDVAPDSRTQKPYGRVFYTRGKSLIFYAFDLDKQPGLRNVSSYQAWGRRGPHDARPLNMGIFYLDSEANRRWMLKFDNPDALAKIDTVFVTVEQKGGSQEPRGKPLLLASLKTQPNHP